jgi:hypothetical protein
MLILPDLSCSGGISSFLIRCGLRIRASLVILLDPSIAFSYPVIMLLLLFVFALLFSLRDRRELILQRR